ncbi:MAG: SMC-Scp complex subunit ScpB [Gemmataceae bacterium]
MSDAANPADASPPPVERIVEAMLFIGGAPLSVVRACEAIRGLTPEGFAQAVAALNRAYREQGRPYRIGVRDDGYEMTLRPGFAAVRERLFGGQREARLSMPALDTLALVAYRQPVTRPEVDSLRGADSLALLRQLVKLGLIAVQRGSSGDAEVCYGTTTRFLQLFGLRNLDDLPRTADLQKL